MGQVMGPGFPWPNRSRRIKANRDYLATGMTTDLEWAFFECLKTIHSPSGYLASTQQFEALTGQGMPEEWADFMRLRLVENSLKSKKRKREQIAEPWDRKAFQFQSDRLARLTGGRFRIDENLGIKLSSSQAMSFLSAGKYMDVVFSVAKAHEFDTVYIAGFKMYGPKKVNRAHGMLKNGHFGIIQNWNHNLVQGE